MFEDDNKPYSNDEYLEEVEELEDFVEDRYEWMLEWLECWENGGEPDDDGYCDE